MTLCCECNRDKLDGVMLETGWTCGGCAPLGARGRIRVNLARRGRA